MRRRWWVFPLVVIVSAAVMVPILNFFATGAVLTWLGGVGLVATSAVLFRNRKALRGVFTLPLAYGAALAAFRFRETVGTESTGFAVALLLFFVLCTVGFVAELFWNPYGDDHADLTGGASHID